MLACDKGGLDCLADVREQHLQLLKIMHAVGLKWAEKYMNENESLAFRLGYHSVYINHKFFNVLNFVIVCSLLCVISVSNSFGLSY